MTAEKRLAKLNSVAREEHEHDWLTVTFVDAQSSECEIHIGGQVLGQGATLTKALDEAEEVYS